MISAMTDERKYRWMVLYGSVCLCVFITGCQRTSDSHTPHFGGADAQGTLLSAEVIQALKVDPSALVVHQVFTINKPKPSASLVLRPYDVVLSVDAHASTQIIQISRCGEGESSCQKSEHFGTSVSFGSESLVSDENGQVTFKVQACVIPALSLSADQSCGAEHVITHQLPPSSQDSVLQAYEAELASLRVGYEKYDARVQQTMKDFADSIDQCDAKTKEYQETEQTRIWVSLGSMLLAAPMRPSSIVSVSPQSTVESKDFNVHDELGVSQGDWDSLVSEYDQMTQLADTKSITQANQCVNRTSGKNKGHLAVVCGIAGLWAVKKKWEIINNMGGIAGVLDHVKSWKLKLGQFNLGEIDFEFLGMAKALMPTPTGSPLQFVYDMGQAIFDLSATHVILPCGQHRQRHAVMDAVFMQFLTQQRRQQCALFKNIKQRRSRLGLSAPKVDVCVEIKNHKKEEDNKDDDPPRSPSEGLEDS